MGGNMKNLPHQRLFRVPIALSLSPGLPPGITQRDCDGGACLPDDWSGTALWRLCDAEQQEAVSNRFVDSHAEILRDAIVDLQDSALRARVSPVHATTETLGSKIWSSWIIFRDRALREMLSRGLFAGPYRETSNQVRNKI
jgi:hypothetical protein